MFAKATIIAIIKLKKTNPKAKETDEPLPLVIAPSFITLNLIHLLY